MQATMFALAAGSALVAPTPPLRPQSIDVKLVAETIAPQPGQTVLIGLEMNPQAGWHGYWSNPGGSGLAPVVEWSAPAGVRFGPLQHPAPTLLQVQGLTSFVHAGPHVLISKMSVPRDLPVGTALPITAMITFAACSDKLCVPEREVLSLSMSVGDGHPSADVALIRRAAAGEPKSASRGRFDVEPGTLVLQPPAGLRLDESNARFFPDQNGFFDAAEARALPGSRLRISSATTGSVPSRITGVLSDGSRSYRLSFERGDLIGATAAVGNAPPQLPMRPRAAAQTLGPPPSTPSATSTSDPPKRPSVVSKRLELLAMLLIALAAFAALSRQYAKSRN